MLIKSPVMKALQLILRLQILAIVFTTSFGLPSSSAIASAALNKIKSGFSGFNFRGTHTRALARYRRYEITKWRKESQCILKSAPCQCPISDKYKPSPKPKCFSHHAFDTCGRRICYYDSRSQFRTKSIDTMHPDMPYYPMDVPGCLCTHLVYGFAEVDSDLTTTASINLRWPLRTDVPCNWPCKGGKQVPNVDHPGMVNCMNMYAKRTNPNLKTILGIGGWHQNNAHFSFMVSNEGNRGKFINDLKTQVTTYGFSGVDIMWLFPTYRCFGKGCGVEGEDKVKFTLLLKEIKAALSGKSVSITVGCHPHVIENSYEGKEIIKYVDWINLMTYDLHHRFDGKTDHPGRLHPEYQGDVQNVDWCVQKWIHHTWTRDPSVPTKHRKQTKRKLVMGISLYANTYAFLTKPEKPIRKEESDPHHNVTLGAAQVYTHNKGYMSYYEVCDFKKKHMMTEARVTSKNEKKVKADGSVGDEPVAANFGTWIGYEDEESIRQKVSYATSRKDLGGVMIWDVAGDDFRGEFCDQGANPMLHLITASCMNTAFKVPAAKKGGVGSAPAGGGSSGGGAAPAGPGRKPSFSPPGRSRASHRKSASGSVSVVKTTTTQAASMAAVALMTLMMAQ